MTPEEFAQQFIHGSVEVTFTHVLDGETPIFGGGHLYCGTEWREKMKRGEYPDECRKLPENLRPWNFADVLHGQREKDVSYEKLVENMNKILEDV